MAKQRGSKKVIVIWVSECLDQQLWSIAAVENSSKEAVVAYFAEAMVDALQKEPRVSRLLPETVGSRRILRTFKLKPKKFRWLRDYAQACGFDSGDFACRLLAGGLNFHQQFAGSGRLLKKEDFIGKVALDTALLFWHLH